MKILGVGVFVFHVKNNRIFKTDFNTIQKVSKLCEKLYNKKNGQEFTP